MNSAKQVATLARLCQRQMSTAVQEVPSKKSKLIKEIQKRFQVDDGIPVFLKAGVKDKALYQATILGTAVGLVMSGQVLYKLAVPQK